MQMQCSVLNCSNSNKNGFCLVKFPKEPEVKDKWIAAMGRKCRTPNPHDRICEAHFKSSDWLDCKNRKLLKSSAEQSCCYSFLPLPKRLKKIVRKDNVRQPAKLYGVKNASPSSSKVIRASKVQAGVTANFKAQQEKSKVTLQRLVGCLEMEQKKLRLGQEVLEAELCALNEFLLWRDAELQELQCCGVHDS